jgi:hypothetical protein
VVQAPEQGPFYQGCQAVLHHEMRTQQQMQLWEREAMGT